MCGVERIERLIVAAAAGTEKTITEAHRATRPRQLHGHSTHGAGTAPRFNDPLVFFSSWKRVCVDGTRTSRMCQEKERGRERAGGNSTGTDTGTREVANAVLLELGGTEAISFRRTRNGRSSNKERTR